ncbi:ATP-binding response regulator [Zavarzinella formosa]|uniref:ATP-binding response regulator n=1 Tax=Zavarzinella formosa TaxID=360055 RepID=UPI00138B176D|nr:ATP-binding protein [Zavarzinella formosa]
MSSNTILIADDDRMCGRILQSWLVKWGYEVVAVNNGTAAFEMLGQPDPPRVAILDWEMPGMDGPEICRQIRAKPDQPQPYILLLTAREGKEHITEGIRSGANDYLCKPVDANELRVRLSVGLSLLEKTDLEAASRQLEKQVEEGYVELATAHANNERLLDSMPCLLVGLDEHGRVSKWNRIAEELFGMTEEQVMGRPFDSLGIDWGETPLHPQISTCTQTRRPARLANVSFAAPNERRGVLDFTLAPVQRAGKDSSLGVLILGEDRTAQRSLEVQLAHAHKLEAIGQLAAGIAHEINTPIQYIGDNTYFLRDAFQTLMAEQDCVRELLKLAAETAPGPAAAIRARMEDLGLDYLSEEIPKAIQQTMHGTEQVSRIVRAMKEFAHPGSEETTPFDMNAAVETTLTVARNEWRYVAEAKTDLQADLPHVHGYPGEINQALLNLIVNAAHAIADNPKPDGTKGRITIRTRLAEGFVEVSIKDDGCGIPEKIRHRIFDPFFTTKPLGKGTGQGLSIVHASIVNRHRGSIRVDSEIGQGTTFTLALPVEQSAVEGGIR